MGNRFGVKNDAGEPLSWDMRAHTYPALIARLIQKFTNSRFRYSEHRDSYDLAYSCVGSMEDYGKKQKPIVGRFTEGFFSEDTVDGDKGELFHHCFYEDSSAHCIAQYEQNSAFDKDAELEDILEQRHTKGSSIDNRPFARFRTTFRPYSCIVDDIVDQVRYTLAFPRRIEVKRPTAV